MGATAIHRHLLERLLKHPPVALVDLADMPERVFGALLIELVDHHQVRKIEHVDFLKLRRRTELGGHDVDTHVYKRRNFGIGLSNPSRL